MGHPAMRHNAAKYQGADASPGLASITTDAVSCYLSLGFCWGLDRRDRCSRDPHRRSATPTSRTETLRTSGRRTAVLPCSFADVSRQWSDTQHALIHETLRSSPFCMG